MPRKSKHPGIWIDKKNCVHPKYKYTKVMDFCPVKFPEIKSSFDEKKFFPQIKNVWWKMPKKFCTFCNLRSIRGDHDRHEINVIRHFCARRNNYISIVMLGHARIYFILTLYGKVRGKKWQKLKCTSNKKFNAIIKINDKSAPPYPRTYTDHRHVRTNFYY